MPDRDCSKTGCRRPAVSSLTFVYEDSTVVLGPLGRTSEPHAYDLCAEHASRMTAPRGWELIRVAGAEDAVDDLVAIAAAIDPRPAEQPRPAGSDAQESRPAGSGAAGSAPAHRPATAASGAAPQTSSAAAGARHLHVVRTDRD